MTDIPRAGVSFPLRVACVDTGSNAIRFQAAEFTSPASFTLLDYERVPVRLGHQVFLTGTLAPETMESAVRAFEDFRDRMTGLGIRHYRAVATSAVREARNGPLLVERIGRDTGIRLEAITGSEEARLVHLAVASRIELAGGRWILVDLGGGSVEVSLVDDSGMLWSESHSMGSVRLLERLAEVDGEPGRFQRLLSEYVSAMRIPAPAQYWEPTGFIAAGGNIEALAALAAAAPDDRGVATLPVADLEAAIDLLARLSYTERMAQLDLREDRADVILPAALVYLRLARLSGADDIRVPHVGVKDGLLLDLVTDLTSHATHEARQESQLTQAAVSLGRRFMFDEAHGLQVARIALSLFDQLVDLHGLGHEDRLLLKAAAILHDIGTFISLQRHHKHSLYIIHHSELPGLSERDMAIVANVARYHRRAHPARHHQDYQELGKEDRIRVDQLSSILRLADAFDRQRLQVVRNLRVEVRGIDLRVDMDGDGDLLLERWAVKEKKGLFEDTFGLRVIVSSNQTGEAD